MYTEFQQLVLGPQVCPTAFTDQELLCPNAQELTLKLVEADSQLQSLQHVMQEIMGEAKAKRSQLDRNALLRRPEGIIHLLPLGCTAAAENSRRSGGQNGRGEERAALKPCQNERAASCVL
ncbi:hypothetical protein E3U43_007809 [Larimichthys crocea]|uniref:Uncharacterized protein n=1 Tax=Larimichthys crocea TaxID=215358 RepID=A0ACD3Q6Q1_LARCR|nr:hypothetical protein E3U43_007809 [Larimichthys crocea]